MQKRGFNIVELLAVLLLIGTTLCLLVACFEGDEQEPAMQNNTQLRSIHEGMTIFAQSNKTGTSEGKFPGLDENGEILPAGEAPDFAPDGADGRHPAVRYAIMLDRNLFSGDDAIAPIDDKTVWGGGSASLSSQNYSYAMSCLADLSSFSYHFSGETKHRRREWTETLNSKAPVMLDRNLGTGSSDKSIWSSDRWEGSVVWNDNRAVYRTSTTADTRYGHYTSNDDDLIGQPGVDNRTITVMVYSDSTSGHAQH